MAMASHVASPVPVTTVSASKNGFIFEERIGRALKSLKAAMETDSDDWIMLIHTEQGIRDFFKEQSLNGVDHMVQIQDPDGQQYLFLIQEKWKLITNQREVSQFLDCCARILARMPDYKGRIIRLWVSRTVPSLNGEKSLLEGQVITVQTGTSQSLLTFNTLIVICELIGRPDLAPGLLGGLGSMLPGKEDTLEDLAASSAADPSTTFQPVSDFGEKRVLQINKSTVVRVKKVE